MGANYQLRRGILNLFQLKEEYCEKQKFIRLNMEKIRMIECKMEGLKATDIRSEIVEGRSKRKDVADLLHQKVELEKEIESLNDELLSYNPIIAELEAIYKELGDRDKQIYIERKIRGYSPVRIGIKWGIDERTVRRIVKKVEKMIECPKMSSKV